MIIIVLFILLVCLGSVQLRPPQPAVYLFVLDVSHNAVETGYLKVFCQSLLDNINSYVQHFIFSFQIVRCHFVICVVVLSKCAFRHALLSYSIVTGVKQVVLLVQTWKHVTLVVILTDRHTQVCVCVVLVSQKILTNWVIEYYHDVLHNQFGLLKLF